MSQRSRPGTGQKPTDPTRMPFEAAEALLWGKATFEQHAYLFKRMQELEKKHTTYDARIQSTEIVAEATEAATSRIRHLEQQIAAIEADEPDKPFNDWITAEVEGIKAFIEQNKSIRQRVILLEKQVSMSEEEANRTTRLAKVLDGLLHRVDEMEARHRSDVDRINVLEKNIKDYITMGYPYPPNRSMEHCGVSKLRRPLQSSLHPGIGSEPNIRLSSRMSGQASKLDGKMDLSTRHPAPMRSDPTEDTEIEENNAPEEHTSDIRASPPRPCEPQTGLPIDLPGLPQIFDTQKMSARLRVMQRKSIYDPKISMDQEKFRPSILTTVTKPQLGEREKNGAPVPETQKTTRSEKTMQQALDGSARTIKVPPKKQMIVKLPVNSSNRKQEAEPYFPRLTRSQAQALSKAQEQANDHPPNPTQSHPKTVSRKNEGSKPQQNKTTLATLQDLGKRKRAQPTMAQKVDGSPTKRKKPNTRKPVEHVTNIKDIIKPIQHTASLIQSSHSCFLCVEANIICDQSQPTCGNCKRRRRAKQCTYVNPISPLPQSTQYTLPNSQKPTTSCTGMSHQNGAKATTTVGGDMQSNTKRMPPKNSSSKDDSHSTSSNRTSRRVKKPTTLPPATATQPDWETYQEMVRQGLIHF